MLFNRGVVIAAGLMQMLICCSQCKPQVSTSSFSDAQFIDLLDVLTEDCEDILETASCLDSKQKNLCDVIGPIGCKRTCGLCPKPKCEDQLKTASCLDSKENGLCDLIGSQHCKKTCGFCLASNFEPSITDRITDNSSPLNEMGGTASLHTSSTDLSTSTYRCAAVLLTDRYLLSAAHCLRRTGKERLTTISLGRENLEEKALPHQIYRIDQVSIHPAYEPAVHDYNDIGVIKSERRIELSKKIWPFCMPARNLVLNDFTPVQIAGWGRVNQTHTSQTLQTKFVKIVKNTRCVIEWQALDSDYYEGIIRQNYPQGLNERLLCGQRDGVSSCEGDSGGPMTFENSNGHTLIGLISKGISCPRTPIAPVFYINIPYYVDWILQTMKDAQPLGPVNCGGPISPSAGPSPVTCATLNCQPDEQCLEGSGSTPSRCQCKSGFGLSGGLCLETCGISTSVDERIGGGPLNISERIVGGKEAIAGKYPWMVQMSYYSSFHEDTIQCGGSLISKRWVLLAAHCVRYLQKNKPVYVYIGFVNLKQQDPLSELFSMYLDDFIIHDEFSASTLENDIALGRLPQDLNFNNIIQPICLGTNLQIPFEGKAISAGWGLLNPADTEITDILQEVQLDVLAENSCGNPQTSICTNTPGKDTCKGDSGVPLMVQQGKQWYVIGISSHGPSDCGSSHLPGIHTRVPNYLPFINSIINL